MEPIRSECSSMTSIELAKKVAGILDSKKATDVVVIDIRKLTTLGDYFVVASGTSTTQVKALVDEVDKQLSAAGLEPKRVEGYNSAAWILMDYYEVIIHVFYQETREFYALERLWSDAPRVDISNIIQAD